MQRILLMVLRNLFKVPYMWFKLCHYAKHTEEYPELEKWQHIQKILTIAVETGNIDLKVTGQENIPEENGFLMYGNHQGMFDVLAIAATCDNPLAAVLKKELANIPFLKQIMQCTNSFAMDREDLRQSMTVISNVIKEVKKGRNYLIFPEGTRSKDGNNVGDFKGGSFKAATKTKCPIVPVALIDSFKPFDTNSINPVDVQVHFLEPLYYEEYKDMKTLEIAEELTSSIIGKIFEERLSDIFDFEVEENSSNLVWYHLNHLNNIFQESLSLTKKSRLFWIALGLCVQFQVLIEISSGFNVMKELHSNRL